MSYEYQCLTGSFIIETAQSLILVPVLLVGDSLNKELFIIIKIASTKTRQ